MYPLHCPHFLKGREHPCASRRAGVTLNLEVLEDRWVPSGTIAATSPPPSFNQAAIVLAGEVLGA